MPQLHNAANLRRQYNDIDMIVSAIFMTGRISRTAASTAF